MRFSKPTLGILSMLVLAKSHAGVPLWTFTPTTATTFTVSATDTATVEYLIQNQSAKPKQLKMLPVSGITQNTSCILSPRGQAGDHCTLNLSIAGALIPAAGIHGGPTVCQTNTDGSPNMNQCYRPSANNSLNITKGNPPQPTPPHLVTVGGSQDPSASGIFPVIFVSDDNGFTWGTTSFPVPGEGALSGAFCLPNSLHCVAVGRYTATGASENQPLSYLSEDGGHTWAFSTPIGMLDYFLNAVSCNANNQCVSVGGQTATLSLEPAAYRSQDGGLNWTLSSPASPVAASATLSSVSCTLQGNLCVSVGYYNDGLSQKPLIYSSTNNGASWNNVSPPPQGAFDNSLQGVFCNDTGSRCVAIGTFRTGLGETLPLAYVSTDNGMSWIASTAFPSPSVFPAINLSAISCDASGNYCVAVGDYEDSNYFLISYISKDGGNSWSLSANLPQPQGGGAEFNALLGIKCNTTATSCTTVGYYGNSQGLSPLSYTSLDGGDSWALSAPFPQNPYLALGGVA